jgi:hypothetical protein
MKVAGAQQPVRDLMETKEARAWGLNLIGQYGKRWLGPLDMAKDIRGDIGANEQGLSCPAGKPCNEQCSSLLDNLPRRLRPFMHQYRTRW